jgi:hypothetical protein
MDTDKFWRTVDEARTRAGDGVDARVGELRAALASLEIDELQQFQNIYDELIRRAYRWDLWGAAYLMNGGCSDDGFQYFRDWLISEGHATFDKALLNPDSLAELPRVELAELESFGYVALELIDAKGGTELDRYSATDISTPAGKPWDEEQLPALFPRLNAIYGS